MTATRLRIGYIPLVDAAALIVAAEFGFAAEENLNIEMVREVSWSNVRDKLNLGLFDAAHMLSPVAIASSLGVGHIRVPLVAPFILGLNGNAITVSPRLYAALQDAADGDITDPKVSALALARIVAERKRTGGELLAFGITFPFSNHNYQLRFWMAAGGIDPDEDARLVVLPPPYMVESLSNGHVDGFCVGAPWNSVAASRGVGHILHFGCEIMARLTEKVLAVRERWASEQPDTLAALVRALLKASLYAENPDNRVVVSDAVAKQLDVSSEVVANTLAGTPTIANDAIARTNNDYIVIGRNGATRPDRIQAAWLYAQIARWGQAPASSDLLERAQGVFRPDLYDQALGHAPSGGIGGPRDGIGAFAGPDFIADDLAGHLASWDIKRSVKPRLTIVR